MHHSPHDFLTASLFSAPPPRSIQSSPMGAVQDQSNEGERSARWRESDGGDEDEDEEEDDDDEEEDEEDEGRNGEEEDGVGSRLRSMTSWQGGAVAGGGVAGSVRSSFRVRVAGSTLYVVETAVAISAEEEVTWHWLELTFCRKRGIFIKGAVVSSFMQLPLLPIRVILPYCSSMNDISSL